MAKKKSTQATTPKPKLFKLATRYGVIIGGDLFHLEPREKDARAMARVMYADDKSYRDATRRKEIVVLKVDIRPAKK